MKTEDRKQVVQYLLRAAKALEAASNPASDLLKQKTIEKQDLSGADLAGANFSKKEIKNCAFKGAGLAKANFSKARFSALVSFEGATLQNAKFDNASFSAAKKVSFRLANLRGVSFKGVNFEKAVSFKGANLTGADFSGANLSNVSLEEAVSTRNIKFDEGTIWPDEIHVDEVMDDLQVELENSAKKVAYQIVTRLKQGQGQETDSTYTYPAPRYEDEENRYYFLVVTHYEFKNSVSVPLPKTIGPIIQRLPEFLQETFQAKLPEQWEAALEEAMQEDELYEALDKLEDRWYDALNTTVDWDDEYDDVEFPVNYQIRADRLRLNFKSDVKLVGDKVKVSVSYDPEVQILFAR